MIKPLWHSPDYLAISSPRRLIKLLLMIEIYDLFLSLKEITIEKLYVLN